MNRSALITGVILLSSFNLFGQDLTFDQTVAYLKKNVITKVMYPGALDAYTRTKGYVLENITIEKNGAITLVTEQKNDANDFKIEFNIFDLVPRVDYPEGVRAYKFLVHFSGLNVSQGYGIAFATDADAERVARAFRYLKSVCVQEDDPFNKPSAEEKKVKLSREETIQYIKTLLPTLDAVYINSRDVGGVGETYVKIYYSNNVFSYDQNTKTYTIEHDETMHYQVSRHEQPFTTRHRFENIKLGSIQEMKDRDVTNYSDAAPYTKPYLIGFNIVLGESCLWSMHSYASRDNRKINLKTIPVYINQSQAVQIERLKKALLRLKELDSEEKDPFDN